MDIGTIKKVIHAAVQACTPDNSSIFRYSISHSSFKIFYNAEKVAGKSFPQGDPAISIALGCALYNIKTCCKALNLTSAIDIAPLESNPNQLAEVTLSAEKSEQLADTLTIEKRHTDRGAYYKKISSSDLENIKSIVSSCSQNSVLLFDGDDKKKIIKLIQSASQIRFQVKEIHALLTHSLRFDNSQPDGLHIDTLALPPGGKYFLKYISAWKNLSLINKIGGYKFLAFQETVLLNNSPSLLILKGGQTREDFINSGEELCKLWTTLNCNDYSVHPYYVIPDILHRMQSGTLPDKYIGQANTILTEGGSLLQEGNNLVYMILRIGKTKSLPTRSSRPPLDSLISRD